MGQDALKERLRIALEASGLTMATLTNRLKEGLTQTKPYAGAKHFEQGPDTEMQKFALEKGLKLNSLDTPTHGGVKARTNENDSEYTFLNLAQEMDEETRKKEKRDNP